MSVFRILTCLGLVFVASMVFGCEVRLKPVVHIVEYHSDMACAASPKDCPWAHLDEQAAFTALVNCLLAGANVIRTEESGRAVESEPMVVAPVQPGYGYQQMTTAGEGKVCASNETVCQVASRRERELTWATCGAAPVQNIAWRGGRDFKHADRLTESTVVTGTLADALDDFGPPQGMDGPDHFYTFSLTEKTRVETGVASNNSYWSSRGPLRSPWQPALYLLSADGKTVQEGKVFRAGVTYLFPAVLEPGTYYLVVDSSKREWSRGKGTYRLYLGLNERLMGPLGS